MSALTASVFRAVSLRGIALCAVAALPLIGRSADLPRPPMPTNPRAGTVTVEQAQQLEERIKADPEDISARTQLLEHYSRLRFTSEEARHAHQQHVLWLIEHRPEIELTGPSVGLDERLDGAAFAEGKKLWLKQVDAHPDNPVILNHAATYLLLSDRNAAEELWTKAESLEPTNPRWPERLAHLYSLSPNPRASADPAAASKALAAMERARSLATEGEFNYLDSLAKMAFTAGELDKARAYAKSLLQQADEHQGQWNYGNAIHTGNIILGRIAVRDAKLAEAKEYLLAAGRTPGSPQLNSFGPNMTLARDLAEKGEMETVAAYFKLCRAFWKMGGDRLDAWTAAVTAGRVPDFGANLRY